MKVHTQKKHKNIIYTELVSKMYIDSLYIIKT